MSLQHKCAQVIINNNLSLESLPEILQTKIKYMKTHVYYNRDINSLCTFCEYINGVSCGYLIAPRGLCKCEIETCNNYIWSSNNIKCPMHIFY